MIGPILTTPTGIADEFRRMVNASLHAAVPGLCVEQLPPGEWAIIRGAIERIQYLDLRLAFAVRAVMRVAAVSEGAVGETAASLALDWLRGEAK